ncbi:MAG: mechanosensitive ion channel family protein [Candidatus Woesearchaeota archaeon]
MLKEFVLDFVTTKYFEALIIIIISVLAANLFLVLFKKFIEKVHSKNQAKVDNKLILKIEHPVIILTILLGAQIALNKISPDSLTYSNILQTIIVIIATYMFIEISLLVLDLWNKQNKQDNIAFHSEVMPLMKSLMRITFSITGVLIILQIWGIAVITLLTSLGIMGLVLGFAFKDSMANIFGGISLILDDSLHKQDVIELDNGERGEVVEINLRSTKIKTLDNNYLIIPNGIMSNSKFYNYNEPTETYRIAIDFSVAYGSDVNKVKEVVLDVLKGRNDILKFPKRSLRLMKMAEFSLNFTLYFFISDYHNMFDIKDEITQNIYEALRKNRIEIPFPTRIIYTRKEKSSRKK